MVVYQLNVSLARHIRFSWRLVQLRQRLSNLLLARAVLL